MSVRLLPLADFVLVVMDDEKDRKTKAGIFLPDTAFDKFHRGLVIAAGPGKYENGHLVPMGCAEGDRIVFAAFDPMVLPDGRKVALVNASRNIIAVEQEVFEVADGEVPF